MEVCLSRKTYSHHHNKCSWKESYARFFFLKFAFLNETFFFIIPISIYSSYNLSLIANGPVLLSHAFLVEQVQYPQRVKAQNPQRAKDRNPQRVKAKLQKTRLIHSEQSRFILRESTRLILSEPSKPILSEPTNHVLDQSSASQGLESSASHVELNLANSPSSLI